MFVCLFFNFTLICESILICRKNVFDVMAVIQTTVYMSLSTKDALKHCVFRFCSLYDFNKHLN